VLTHLELGANREGKGNTAVDIPDNYRGISFSSWLDIFLEYALCLVKVGRHLESYEICEAAKDAIVFYHSRDDMFLIHICWCSKFHHSVYNFH
jgi:general transcription factor 3C polypeptide 3 (transcription factor C subunit 4)